MRRLTIGLLFLILVLSYQINSTFPQYIVFLILLLLLVISVLIGFRVPRLVNLIDYLPLLMIFLWGYGVILGFLMGNKISFIIQNFAGMLLYIIYYILRYYNLSKVLLFKILLFAAFVNTLYVSLSLSSVNFFIITSTLMDLRVYYSVGLFVIAPIIMLSLVRVAYGRISEFHNMIVFNNKLLSFLVLIVTFFSYAIFPMSKGFFASAIVMVTGLSLLIVLQFILKGKLPKPRLLYLIFSLLICSCFIVMLVHYGVWDMLVYQFSSIQPGNLLRDEQKHELVNHLTLLGHGLGATITGYTRSEGSDYAFELTYYNLVHKVGIFALIALFVYASTFFYALRNLMNEKCIVYSSLSIGCMMFLIPSYGNPMLFAPVAVTLHCFALYFINNRAGGNLDAG